MDDSVLDIQLISDIHLELLPESRGIRIEDLITVNCSRDSNDRITVLVLAGDIGNPFSDSYSKFLRSCVEKYSHVVLVAGNHEFYNGQSMNFVIQKIRRVVDELNDTYERKCLHFLNVDTAEKENITEKISVVIDGVKFIGTTLWSDISTIEKTSKVSDGRWIKNPTINDFSIINSMSRARYQQLHLLHRSRLHEEIENSVFEYDKIVVVTHHLPTYELISDEFVGSQLNPFFASDCSDLISSLSEVVDGKAVWLCGHSHSSKHVNIKGVDLYLNPLGYKGEQTGYTSDVITI